MHEPYNAKVDVYSFAMICYQLFEGQSPFSGINAISAARQAAMQRSRPAFQPLGPGNIVREVRFDTTKDAIWNAESIQLLPDMDSGPRGHFYWNEWTPSRCAGR